MEWTSPFTLHPQPRLFLYSQHAPALHELDPHFCSQSSTFTLQGDLVLDQWSCGRWCPDAPQVGLSRLVALPVWGPPDAHVPFSGRIRNAAPLFTLDLSFFFFKITL